MIKLSPNRTALLAACWLAMMCLAPGCFAENWPRFRGPNGSGVASGSDLPSEWSEDHYRWVADLGGSGSSSPVIWHDRLFVTAADGESQQRWLICLDRSDGSERWRAASSFDAYKKHKNNSYAASTPAVDAECVYQLWHSREQTTLIAYDHQGNEIWKHQLGPYLHGQGGATSPIVAGELVIVAHDHRAGSHLLAVDRKTGEPRWKIPREGSRACYSTPCLRRTAAGDTEAIFVHCYEGVIGVNLETGQRRWHVDPFGRDPQRALASPILAGELVIAGSGAVGGDRTIVAIDAESESAEEVYRIERSSPHVPTPLALAGRLYLWNDGGIVSCCDAASGDVIWRKRVGGNYFSSPIAVGDRIFSMDVNGEVVVIASGDEFRLLGRNKIDESSRASLAAADGTLYVRTATKVTAIGPQ